MANYTIPEPGCPSEIGARARRLRNLLGMTVSEVAQQAHVEDHHVNCLEDGLAVSLSAALAIHQVLSAERLDEALFTRPRLRTIDEVENFEKRRLASR